MTKVGIARGFRILGMLVATSAAGCSSDGSDRSADTNTSWMKPCVVAADCGSGACVAGYCAEPASPPATPPGGPPPASEEWNITVSRAENQAGAPDIRWIDGRFVVAWLGSALDGSGSHVARAEISAAGVWSDTLVPYQGRIASQLVLSGDGEIAVPSYATFASGCAITVYDASLSPAGNAEIPCTSDAAVAPAGGGAWVVAHGLQVASDVQSVVVDRFDPGGANPLSGSVAVGTTHSDQSLTLYAFADEASVVWPTPGGSALQVVGGVQGAGGLALASQAAVAGTGPYGGYGFGRIGGHELLFGTNGAALWTADVTTPGQPLAPRFVAATGVADRDVGVAAANELGIIGVCFGTGPGPGGGFGQFDDGVSFVAVDADGEVVAGPTVIEDAFTNIGGCSVAWSGQEFAVAYWKIKAQGATSELRVRRIEVSP